MQIAPLAQSGSYPPHRQPYARLRAELIQSLLSASQFVEAFLQQLVIFFYIDPVHFPQSFHPVRLSHKYFLYRISLHLATLAYEQNNRDEEVLALLAKMPGLDFRVIAIGLLRDISSGVAKGFGEESRFAKIIEAEKAGSFSRAAEEKGITDRMVGEMWKHFKVLVGAALHLTIA